MAPTVEGPASSFVSCVLPEFASCDGNGAGMSQERALWSAVSQSITRTSLSTLDYHEYRDARYAYGGPQKEAVENAGDAPRSIADFIWVALHQHD